MRQKRSPRSRPETGAHSFAVRSASVSPTTVDLRDVDFAHVEAAVRALEGGATGTYLMKPGISLRIERGSMRGIITER